MHIKTKSQIERSKYGQRVTNLQKDANYRTILD